MIEDLLRDVELSEKELIEKYGEIPSDIPNAPQNQTLEEAQNNGIDTEMEVDSNETSNENIQA